MSDPARADLRGVQPIERRSMSELVADHIRILVFDGTLRPGDRVPTESIAEALGVSTLPVREAVKVLGRDGLLELRPHRGAYVGQFDERFLREHFEFVGMVQASAAVGTLLADNYEAMAELSDLAARARSAETPAEVHSSVMEFLGVIDRTGGSPAQRAVRDALGRLLSTGYFAELPGAAKCGQRGLGQILRALRSGDPDAVRAACVQVQQERCEVVVAHLKATGVLPS